MAPASAIDAHLSIAAGLGQVAACRRAREQAGSRELAAISWLLREFPGDLDFGSQNFAAGLDRNGGGFPLGGERHTPRNPSIGWVGWLCRDFQNPAQLKTKPIYVSYWPCAKRRERHRRAKHRISPLFGYNRT
jgi:hypothetical protein